MQNLHSPPKHLGSGSSRLFFNGARTCSLGAGGTATAVMDLRPAQVTASQEA